MAEIQELLIACDQVLIASMDDAIKRSARENITFRLFTRLTPALLQVFCCMTSLTSLIGYAMQCTPASITDLSEKENYFLNNYCLVAPTYTVAVLWDGNTADVKTLAHVGVGPKLEQQESQYHAYYIWVPIVLLLQSGMFKIPQFCWKYCQQAFPISSISISNNRLEVIDDKKKQIYYSYSYVICEISNLIVLAIDWQLNNKLLNENFNSYGFQMAQHLFQPENQRSNPMDIIFPKVMKCDFMKFGPSGSLVQHDVICVLAINILNEKLYLFLWFFFAMLFIFGVITLILRVALMTSKQLRLRLTLWHHVPDSKQKILRSQFQCIDLNYYQWFILNRSLFSETKTPCFPKGT